jgi:hypothetical protein
MTDLYELPLIDPVRGDGRRRPVSWHLVLVAPFAGAALGALARWWMRLISDDPEFTWSGTIFIVLAFAIAGTGHGLAWAARRAHRRRRWTTTARVVATALTLPIFTGAGAVMLPTVLAVSLAVHRRSWPRPVRALLAVIALPIPVAVVVDVIRHDATPWRVLGLLLMLATYAVIVRSLAAVVAPIGDGWRMPRPIRVLAAVAAVLLVLLALAAVVSLVTAS